MSLTLDNGFEDFSVIQQVKDFTSWLEYIPGMSTAHALTALFNKCVNLPEMRSEEIARSKYYTYLNNTSYVRQLVLLIPVLGNVTIFLLDRFFPVNYHRIIVFEESKESELGAFRHLKYEWLIDDTSLFLDLHLAQGLIFPKTYSIFNFGQRQICMLSIKPAEGYEVISTKGNLLQEITLKVQVKNDPNDVEQVYSELELKTSYKNAAVHSYIDLKETIIPNFYIDLDEDPQFYTYEKAANKAAIFFKSLLPYEKIEGDFQVDF